MGSSPLAVLPARVLPVSALCKGVQIQLRGRGAGWDYMASNADGRRPQKT